MKKVLFALFLVLSGFVTNAQIISPPIYRTFYADTYGGYVLPPGGGAKCQYIVTVTYTSMSGGYPISVVLSHTFNLGDTYTFTLNNPAPDPMIEYTFSVPCQNLEYGPYPESSLDSHSIHAQPANGGGDEYLFVSPSGNTYSFDFETPVGI